MKISRAASAAGAVILAVVIALATAGAAKAGVLVNYDGGTIHLGQYLKVGVWYQPSGGPHGYWEGVWSYPQHRWIFTRSGQVSGPNWQFNYVRPSVRGEYATVYGITGAKATFYTKVI